ncbi:MAG: hypothetical protein JW717_01750 [Marinilabiliaceae bacterium]|nr:hypothetical protein [Marinilabiliaceae bacterium]
MSFLLLVIGYVYEMFGISKHLPVNLQVLLIRAEMPDNPLTTKCFIYDVRYWALFIFSQLRSFYALIFVLSGSAFSRAFKQAYSLTSFGCALDFRTTWQCV